MLEIIIQVSITIVGWQVPIPFNVFLVFSVFGWLVGWSVGRLVCWFVGWFVGLLVGLLVCLFVLFVYLFVHWFVHWFVNLLVMWIWSDSMDPSIYRAIGRQRIDFD